MFDPSLWRGCEVCEAMEFQSFRVPWVILTLHLMSPFHQNQICRLTYFPVSGQDSDLYENKLAVTQAR